MASITRSEQNHALPGTHVNLYHYSCMIWQNRRSSGHWMRANLFYSVLASNGLGKEQGVLVYSYIATMRADVNIEAKNWILPIFSCGFELQVLAS